MQCASCGFVNQAGTKFCTECGTRLVNLRVRCNFENPLPAKFCGEGGQALTPQAVASPQVTDQAAPDRDVSIPGEVGSQPVPPAAELALHERP